MGVDSLLEMYTTLWGWHQYGVIWDIMKETGLAFIPFFGILLNNFVSAIQSQYTASASATSLNAIELDFIRMLIVIILAVQPTVNLEQNKLNYVPICLGKDNELNNKKVTMDGVGEGLAASAFVGALGKVQGGATDIVSSYSSLNIEAFREVKVPVWWFGIMSLSHGIVHAAQKGIPCVDDLRTARFKISTELIKDTEIQSLLIEFGRHCVIPARENFIKDVRKGLFGELDRFKANGKVEACQGKNDGEKIDDGKFIRNCADLILLNNTVELYGIEDTSWMGSLILSQWAENGKYYKGIPARVWESSINGVNFGEYLSEGATNIANCHRAWNQVTLNFSGTSGTGVPFTINQPQGLMMLALNEAVTNSGVGGNLLNNLKIWVNKALEDNTSRLKLLEDLATVLEATFKSVLSMVTFGFFGTSDFVYDARETYLYYYLLKTSVSNSIPYTPIHNIGVGGRRSLVQEIGDEAQALAGYGGRSKVFGFTNKAISTAGQYLYYPIHFTMIDGLRKVLPIVGALMMMGLYIFLPFGLLFSGYSLKFLLVGAVGIFTFKFNFFLWHLVWWLDQNLMLGLGASPLEDSFGSFSVTIDMVSTTLYIGLPILWTAMVIWTGIQLGDRFGGMASETAEDTTSQATTLSSTIVSQTSGSAAKTTLEKGPMWLKAIASPRQAAGALLDKGPAWLQGLRNVRSPFRSRDNQFGDEWQQRSTANKIKEAEKNIEALNKQRSEVLGKAMKLRTKLQDARDGKGALKSSDIEE